MAKKFDFFWHVPVSSALTNGQLVDCWTEDKDSSELEQLCTIKVDECGFFLHWKSDNAEADLIELCQVNDIRPGGLPKDLKLLNQLMARHGGELDSRSITVYCGTDPVNIFLQHIVFSHAGIAKEWLEGLSSIIHNTKSNNLSPMACLMKHWMRLSFSVDVDGRIPVKNVSRTFASGKTEKFVYQCIGELGLPFEKTDVIEPSDFTFDKFYQLYHKLCPRSDIEELFQTIAGSRSEFINLDQLINFLNDSQRDPRLNEILHPYYDPRRARELIATYEVNESAKAQDSLSREGLTRYLMSEDNAAVFLDRLDIYQDMDQPLCHYYINSSHNTYLTGRQFGGKSSVEMYRQVLLLGCRCVELDCWDGRGEDEEPTITHGKAMCTDILFKDAILAIRDSAFVTSEYPLILSFENHCSKAQQLKMALYCDEIFGDLLLKEPLPDFPLEPGVPLPSPNQLKRKILIKNKRLLPDVEKQELELFLKGQLTIVDDVKEDATVSNEDNKVLMCSSSQDADVDRPLTAEEKAYLTYQYTGATSLVHPYLSNMVNYAQPVKFAGFDEAREKNMHYHMSSFSETNGLGLLKSSAIEFVHYNKRQMSRIYPKGTRADSSNYMPQIFWNTGCQMVSLNFQTPDLPMQLNQGKFEYNGNCGYLLKPDFMRRPDKYFDPFAETPVDGVIAAQCSVQVIAGQFLSDKKIGTYVEVDMYGLPTDTIRKEFRTKMVPANGLNPVYNEPPFVFRKIVLPDLALLRIAVFDENGRLLGQRILPLDGLQAGYRHVSLRSEANYSLALPMLFCRFDLKIYVPDGLGDLMDALSDPRAFLSNQEKRDVQLKAMGIEDSDLQAIRGLSQSSDSSKMSSNQDSIRKEDSRKDDTVNTEVITVESLREDKNFIKATKKQRREMDIMKKKHSKERMCVQKSQCSCVEKMIKEKRDHNDPAVLDLVRHQIEEWSQMLERQKTEEQQMLKEHGRAQEEILRKMLKTAHMQQQKQLDIRFERESRELRSQQAKISVDTTKEVIQDRSLRNKAERERIIREKNQNNTKKFMEERRVLALQQEKESARLKKQQEQQLVDMSRDIKNCMDICGPSVCCDVSSKFEFYA